MTHLIDLGYFVLQLILYVAKSVLTFTQLNPRVSFLLYDTVLLFLATLQPEISKTFRNNELREFISYQRKILSLKEGAIKNMTSRNSVVCDSDSSYWFAVSLTRSSGIQNKIY